VVADLPGVEKANIMVRLLSPTDLEISGERRSEQIETGEGGKVLRRERTSGYMARTVTLPHGVTTEGAMTSFTNGVLDLRLKKSMPERGERIPIE
jgi:HSP20 family protein